MNKHQFLNSLYLELSALPEAERQKSLDYYAEMIDDRIEDGMSEEEAVAAMGTAQSVAKEVLLNQSLPTLIKTKVKKSHSLKGWEIAMLIIGAPLWIPLLVGFAAILLSLYLSVWAVIIGIYATFFALAVSLPACIIAAIIVALRGQLPTALMLLGTGFILGGLSIFGFIGTNLLVKGWLKLTQIMLRGIKSLFVSKEEYK